MAGESDTIGRPVVGDNPIAGDVFRPLVLGIDAGGTMTDTFVVAEDGAFALGKAATTPADESVGFIESALDAALQRGIDPDRLFPDLSVVLYAGTTMLNTLLSRTGKRLGVITTKGFEDAVQMGRGMQIWAGYSYADRLHAVTHVHPDPLVPRDRMLGVTERVDMFGDVVMPLYEHEVVAAAERLLAEEVEAICVSFLFSFVNPAHERRAADILRDVLAEHGAELPVYLAHEVRPVLREHSRMNSTLIEAYAAAPVRQQLFNVEASVHERGFPSPLQTVLSYGGLANIRYPRLHETLISGPVGGVLGAKFIGDIIGEQNLIVTDLGGTSFDIGAITQGVIPIDSEPVLARFKLSLPTIALDSIGAGCGTIVKVDPLTHRIELGPESAGSEPGPVCFDRGGERVTVADCDLLLGYLNPLNFLGGKVILNPEKAEQAVREQVTDVLSVDLHEGCEGVVKLLEAEARMAIQEVITSRGYNPSSYVCMGYGGAGPLHLAGYSRGLDFKAVMTFPFAAAFSAFGCTTADFLHRYSESVRIELPAEPSADDLAEADAQIDAMWKRLQSQAREEFGAEGADVDELDFSHLAMMRYAVQLDDLEVTCPGAATSPAAELIERFEDLYERINRRVAKYRKGGFLISEVGLFARIRTPKPVFPTVELGEREPGRAAHKGTRQMYADGEWHEAQIWEMDELRPGNVIDGPSIVEHSMTTLVVPLGMRVSMDERGFLWLSEPG
jgi:acetone carboxylase, beta subunit